MHGCMVYQQLELPAIKVGMEVFECLHSSKHFPSGQAIVALLPMQLIAALQ